MPPRRSFLPSTSHTRNPQAHNDPLSDDTMWARMDRVQVLGKGPRSHEGCVNALSWSDDGQYLLSGSDDQKLIIWTSEQGENALWADYEDDPVQSPHPLRFKRQIRTGHRANIFSAKFLPHANAPTIVSVAGDREIRVIEIDRAGMELDQERSWEQQSMLGNHGVGIRVLNCHTDRTKKVETENSPFLFLTVSEDGTVRQHDLRRPHQCRSECPEPLFRGPRDVEMYSLSVSGITPHIFTVAGRSESAYVCDRRMTERQTSTWGTKPLTSGQVHCVRRLGLSEDMWAETHGPRLGIGHYQDRSITSVRMSNDIADEVVCSFSGHSVSLFSIHDSPQSESMKHGSHSPISAKTSPRVRARGPDVHTSASPTLPDIVRAEASGGRPGAKYSAEQFEASPGAKRRREESGSEGEPSTRPRATVEEEEGHDDNKASENGEGDGTADENMSEGEWEDVEEEEERNERSQRIENAMMRLMQGSRARAAGESLPQPPPDDPFWTTRLRDSDDERSITSDDILTTIEAATGGNPDDNAPPVIPDDGPTAHWGPITSIEEDNDEGSDEDDDEDEDGDMWADEDDMFDDDMFEDEDDMDEDDDDFDPTVSPDQPGITRTREVESAYPLQKQFDAVEMILPRRSFRGARNSETVKDCNFLGSRSEKVVSGSDDGNFFVWDKATGRIDGIWEGDKHIVNVVEQHPTLPVLAVSGIDRTVKIFAPLPQRPERSMSRLHMKDRIVEANSAPVDRNLWLRGMHSNTTVLDYLASRGISARFLPTYEEGDEEDELGGSPPECATQ